MLSWPRRLPGVVRALTGSKETHGFSFLRTPPQNDTGDWIDTWTASPQPIWDAEFFAPINVPRALRNQTVRQIAAISIGGNRVRVVLSNEYGSKPLVIGAAHVAVAGSGAAIVAGSDRALSLRRPPLGHDPTGCTSG
jgi:hypothetical protein